MVSFIASYKNEWEKLIARKKYIVFLCIGLSFCLIWALIGQLISSFLATQGTVFSAFTLSPTPMGTLPFFLQFLVPFLMFMGVTDLLTVEGSDNTMKAMICRPVERWKLYFAKILAVLTYAALYLLCVFVVSAVLNQFFGKPLDIKYLLIDLASYTLTLIPLAILACFAGIVALFGKSGTLSMFLLLFLYVLLNALPVLFPVLNEMLFTSYLGWYKLWIGALPGASKLIHMMLIVFAYGIVFATAGSLLFDRKEY